jgi:tripartite-type tricarboxylate transporter receptor subunit TctC
MTAPASSVRRTMLLGLAATALPSFAQTSAYPSGPVRLIIPFPAGGPSDVLGRVIALKLTDRWKQQVIVDNKPGGSTVIGAVEAARARPDGLTLFMPIDSTLTMNPALFSKLPYQPLKDFTHISLLATQSLVLLANDRTPAKSVPELVALAKAQPGKIDYGSGTISTQLAGEMFNRAASVKLNYVPYKGSADVVKAMLSGEIPVSFDGIAPNVPHIKSGRFRALATTGLQRSAALPEVPTLHELGLRDFEVRVWLGLSAPAGTPEPIVHKIQTDVQAVMAMPEVRDQLLPLGLESIGAPTDAFLGVVRAETARYTPLIKELGIRLD